MTEEEQKGGGKFMSDLLIMDGDDVKVNNYNIFPCSAPLHPQFGVLGRGDFFFKLGSKGNLLLFFFLLLLRTPCPPSPKKMFSSK